MRQVHSKLITVVAAIMVLTGFYVQAAVITDLREVYGEVQSINGEGSFVLVERAGSGAERKSGPVAFVFDPKKLVVMQSPSRQPVQLMVKPGDIVKVEFTVRDDRQWARTVTLYAPKETRTTTTTTVTTTQ